MSLLDDVAELVRVRSGLQLDAVMRTRLQRALVDQRRAGESDAALLERLSRDPLARQQLYDELTVQETSFFRDPGQFAGLAEQVLPLLPDPLVLWSAGCSNGQEAYSLAMVLAEQGRSGTVLATDLSERALARTRAGRYAERELRGLSPERRARFLVPDGDGHSRVVPSLLARVSVRRHNLASDAPPVGRVPVVFCRNVLIYFGRDDVLATVRRLHEVLPPDGWLFLGFSESLWEMTAEFRSVRLGEAYAYRRGGAATAAAAGGPSSTAARPTRSAPTDPGGAAPHAAPSAAPAWAAPASAAPAWAAPAPPAPSRPAAHPSGLRPPPGPAAEAAPEVTALLAEGERALRGGLAADAVTAFRGATYLAPDLPLAHVELGLALHALGEGAAARRALQTARRVLSAGGAGVAGWDVRTLDRWIGERLDVLDQGGA